LKNNTIIVFNLIQRTMSVIAEWTL